jgi:hypothetical protein
MFYVLYQFVTYLLTLPRISVQIPTADSFCGHPVYNWVVTYSEACLRKILGIDPSHYRRISNRGTMALGVKKGLRYTKPKRHMIQKGTTLLGK